MILLDTNEHRVKKNSYVMKYKYKIQVKRDIFRRNWTRRIVVCFLARQMQLVLNRQERRSPRYSRVADLAARRDCGASAMPGGRLGGSNRGTRRFVSVAGLMQQISVHAVS